MRSRSIGALGAAFLVLGATASAEAQDYDQGPMLPPVSGTLRMAPDEFGGDQPGRYRPAYRRDFGERDSVQVVRGGLYPTATSYQGLPTAERWATGGTGVSGLIGNTGNPYLGETGWGTADSATTGAGFAPRRGWQRRGLFTSGDAPLAGLFGGAPGYAGASYDYPAYGAAPQVPFYGSGAPYSMSYYGSGSSAGPYGSPGGLGVYRSGSYGYGPRVIRTRAYAHRGWGSRQGCTCGPHIVHVRRIHRYYSER